MRSNGSITRDRPSNHGRGQGLQSPRTWLLFSNIAVSCKCLTGVTATIRGDTLRRARGQQQAAAFAALGTQVDDPVRTANLRRDRVR